MIGNINLPQFLTGGLSQKSAFSSDSALSVSKKTADTLSTSLDSLDISEQGQEYASIIEKARAESSALESKFARMRYDHIMQELNFTSKLLSNAGGSFRKSLMSGISQSIDKLNALEKTVQDLIKSRSS